MATKIEVTFVQGFSPKTKATAKAVHAHLDKIRQKEGGTYTPEHVVSALKSPKHPLHGELTWVDSEAAHSYRLAEAAKLMRSVYVVQIDDKPVPPRRIDIRVNDQTKKAPKGPAPENPVYTDERTVLATPDFRIQVASRAWDELCRWTERHQWLVDNGLLPKGLMDAVQKALQTHPRP